MDSILVYDGVNVKTPSGFFFFGGGGGGGGYTFMLGYLGILWPQRECFLHRFDHI